MVFHERSWQPDIIPADVTEYFLRRSGFECEDPVVVKMIGLAAQKFLTDLAKESYAFSKKRQQATGTAQQKSARRNVLLLEDVANAAQKFGVRVVKPEYFADSVTAGLAVEPSGGGAGAGGEKRGMPPAAAVNPAARKKKKN